MKASIIIECASRASIVFLFAPFLQSYSHISSQDPSPEIEHNLSDHLEDHPGFKSSSEHFPLMIFLDSFAAIFPLLISILIHVIRLLGVCTSLSNTSIKSVI